MSQSLLDICFGEMSILTWLDMTEMGSTSHINVIFTPVEEKIPNLTMTVQYSLTPLTTENHPVFFFFHTSSFIPVIIIT